MQQDIIPAICFIISYCFFALYIAYILIKHYLIDNLENSKIVNENEKICRKIYIIDWY